MDLRTSALIIFRLLYLTCSESPVPALSYFLHPLDSIVWSIWLRSEQDYLQNPSLRRVKLFQPGREHSKERSELDGKRHRQPFLATMK